jgi:glucosamine--fructose-6-phosphate aminotransferase (isomerizing)
MKRLMNIVFLTSILVSHSYLTACSIVGYIGDVLCKDFIQQGLERLEYRGYDSAGFASIDAAQDLFVIKAEGKLEKLKEKLKNDPRNGYAGIGHTRWATHGPATQVNAHPHTNEDGTIAVVHNGIIDNYFLLKEQLIRNGHTFTSETDTEVIPHLLDDAFLKYDTLELVVQDVAKRLKGTFAIIALFKQYPDTLIVLRKTSPLCIGIGEHETFIASDFLAFAGRTKKVTFVPDESFAIIKKDSIALYSFEGKLLSANVQVLDVPASAYQKFEHEHFMLKEIYEQPKVIRAAVAYYKSLGSDIWNHLGMSNEYARTLRSINLFGCGTSWHAARIGQFFFELIAGTPASTHLASEFRYMPFFPQNHSLFIGISQSGETADTLEALRLVKSYDIPVVTITNSSTSTMARESIGFLPLKAGPEIAVASTKAFTTQVTALYWLAHCLAIEKGVLPADALEQAEKNLLHAADILEQMIEKYRMDIITTHAKKYAQAKRCMYLGRHIGYPFAMEAALKLKEISYIFAQGYPAGELKHGSIALVDTETPAIFFSHLDPVLYAKLVANVQEVKARKGHIIAFAFEGQTELIKLADQVFIIPRVAPLLEPLAMAGLMQFFAYQIAKELGRDIDQPRNLAKAVTVE